jgi:hypothetical protein
MARHNRQGRGTDQRGVEYEVSYQPDWLRQVKVTRTLANGRQSTKTLFRNESAPERAPGARVRTRITSKEAKVDIEVGIDDPQGVIKRVVVETAVPGRTEGEILSFTIDDRVDAPKRRGRRRSTSQDS